MKKIIGSLLTALLLLISGIFVNAVEINLYAPSETEIMPTRDFYVVGAIDRDGQTASNMPLNIRIELIDNSGNIIRELESSINPNGVTDAIGFMSDYEYGQSVGDSKGANLAKYTTPDVIFDGYDRDTIRIPYNKIVVKENYFAATIYGGATKELNLRYTDKTENPLKDLTKGTYKLVITALNLEGEEVSKFEKPIVVDDKAPRIIASDAQLQSYATENNLVLPNSIVGSWHPYSYIDAPKDYYYTIGGRYINNLITEFGNSENVHIFLKNIDGNDREFNNKLGSVFTKDSKVNVSYMYYDIGENTVEFNFSGSQLQKMGTIVTNENDSFIEILRADTTRGGNTYMDFNCEDGFVLTAGNTTKIYGVYSPIITNVHLAGDNYSFTDKAYQIKAIIADTSGNIIKEDVLNSEENEEDVLKKYEFEFELTPTLDMLKQGELKLFLSICDSNGEALFESEEISLTANYSGRFISGYDDTYWGKSFCDTVNALGQSPSGESLNPDDLIKRGDFAAMINRLMGYSLSAPSKFSDLPEDSVYYKDCTTAQAVGYMTGDEKGRVTAEEPISREQAMIILARISKAEKSDNITIFKDSDNISFWAKDYVDAMCSTGIVTGFNGYLNPTDSITVAEASALIIKTIKWMYGQKEIASNDLTNKSEASDNGADLSDVDMSEVEFISDISSENIIEFFRDNKDAFLAIRKYITENCPNGAYVGKVGNGLELRDYKMGNFLKFSNEAIDVITSMSSKFAVFSIKYNPAKQDVLYFSFGKNDDKKDTGILYTKREEVEGKNIELITENWYYYIQK